MSDQIVRTTDYDFDQLHVDTNLILHLALRAKKLGPGGLGIPGPPARPQGVK